MDEVEKLYRDTFKDKEAFEPVELFLSRLRLATVICLNVKKESSKDPCDIGKQVIAKTLQLNAVSDLETTQRAFKAFMVARELQHLL